MNRDPNTPKRKKKNKSTSPAEAQMLLRIEHDDEAIRWIREAQDLANAADDDPHGMRNFKITGCVDEFPDHALLVARLALIQETKQTQAILEANLTELLKSTTPNWKAIRHTYLHLHRLEARASGSLKSPSTSTRYLDDGIETLTKKLGYEHDETVKFISRVGAQLVKDKNYFHASQIYERLCMCLKIRHHEESEHLGGVFFRMADLEERLGEPESAIILYQKAWLHSLFGFDRTPNLKALGAACRIHMSLDQFDIAAAKLTTAQTFAQAFYGPTDQRTLAITALLQECRT